MRPRGRRFRPVHGDEQESRSARRSGRPACRAEATWPRVWARRHDVDVSELSRCLEFWTECALPRTRGQAQCWSCHRSLRRSRPHGGVRSAVLEAVLGDRSERAPAANAERDDACAESPGERCRARHEGGPDSFGEGKRTARAAVALPTSGLHPSRGDRAAFRRGVAQCRSACLGVRESLSGECARRVRARFRMESGVRGHAVFGRADDEGEVGGRERWKPGQGRAVPDLSPSPRPDNH